MDITLYNCSTEPNRLDKSSYLTSVASYENAAANIELGVERPTILIQTSTDLSEVNYAYIAEFDRYYNVNAIHAPVNDMWRIECEVDVLMTYKDEIAGLTGIVRRNEDNYDMYLHDDLIPVGAKKTFSVMKFPTSAFSGQNSKIYIMTVGGD